MLVTTAELATHLGDPEWVVFDCRHDLMDLQRGARMYREGHIPGARFAAVESDLSGAKTGSNGRHPLPLPAAFMDFLACHGVTNDSKIIAYDDSGGLYAARLWWLARWVGLTDVSLLDGGLPKWLSEGRELTTQIPSVERTPLAGHADPEAVWTAADVLRHLQDPEVVLIDARAAERYRGDVEPIDPVAGHIPGALNRFYRENLKVDLTFRTPEDLQREFRTLIGSKRLENVVHHCGSGITACANLFAMEYAGLGGSKLYNGSWSEWVSDPSRPTEPARS
jgi:thiosulfate/3-mercaptopyruvate sulfurtransferase